MKINNIDFSKNNNNKIEKMTFKNNFENLIRNERTGEWFETFLNHSNEKHNTGIFISKLFQNYIDSNKENQSQNILDLGCGNGLLSQHICKIFSKNKIDIKYYGIEKNSKFVAITSNRLKEIQTPHDILEGDCFGEALSSFNKDIDVLFVSHSAYYLNNNLLLNNFIKTSFDKIKKNGIAVLIHESSDSDFNLLGGKYKGSNFIDTANQLTKAIKHYSFEHKKIELDILSLDSEVYFPENMPELWNEINKNSCQENYISDKNNFHIAKYLLEFIAETPLEVIASYEELHEYLSRVKNSLETQSNQLKTKNIYHICKFK